MPALQSAVSGVRYTVTDYCRADKDGGCRGSLHTAWPSHANRALRGHWYGDVGLGFPDVSNVKSRPDAVYGAGVGWDHGKQRSWCGPWKLGRLPRADVPEGPTMDALSWLLATVKSSR